MPTKPKIINDQRGIGLVIEIIVGAVVLVIIGLAVMQYLKAKDSSGGSTSLIPAGATLNGNCELKDTDLCKFTNNWKGMKNYTIKASQTDKDGKKSVSTFEIAGDDKFHMSTTTDGKEVFNMIAIGNTTYTLDYTDNKWWEMTSDSTSDAVKSGFEFKADEDSKDEPAADKSQYKALGKETCDKLKCFKYEVIEPGATAKQYIWFDDRDYLLRRVQTTSDGDGTSDMTFSYNKPTINVPTPTKKAAN
jgi:outer membrane lipoprotein-sorting protein